MDYSMSHGAVEGISDPILWRGKLVRIGPFQGLEFKDGYITAAKLKEKNLDYRLVLVDACFSAQTVWQSLSEEAAAASNTLSPTAAAFANSFGPNVAYVGWAWMVDPSVSQKYMAELVQNLLYDNSLKRGRTVAEAYQKLLSDYSNDVKATRQLSLMKLYGATDNVIDFRKGK